MSGHTTPAVLAHALWQRRDGLLQEAWARDPGRARVQLHEWLRTDGLPLPPVPPFIAWVWARHAAAAQRWWEVYRREVKLREAEIAPLEQAIEEAPTEAACRRAQRALAEALEWPRRSANHAQAAVLAAPPTADEVVPTGELVCPCCPQHDLIEWRNTTAGWLPVMCPGLQVCPHCFVVRWTT